MDPTVTVIPASHVRSLAWQGELLVDWVGGIRTYAPDGTATQPRVSWAYPFDDVRTSPSGGYILLLDRLGTKGLVLRGGKILREINRSFYHADRYDYPATIFRLRDGRDVLAHCPDAYNRIDLDELPSFHRLTPAGAAGRPSIFHSRLVANPAGTRLLTAGWVWHPVGMAGVIDVDQAVGGKEATAFTQLGSSVEIDEAIWLSDDRVATVSGTEDFEEGDADRTDANRPGSVGVFDVAAGRFTSVVPCGERVGHLMPVGPSHVVGFHDHPKLIDLSTGGVVYRWAELKTGYRSGPIDLSDPTRPAVAVDLPRRRFAVAGDSTITVVQLPADLPSA